MQMRRGFHKKSYCIFVKPFYKREKLCQIVKRKCRTVSGIISLNAKG